MLNHSFAWLQVGWVRRSTFFGLMTVLAVAACGQLEQKERELTFRVQPGEASWYGGLPDGVEEFNIPIAAEDGKAQHIHAWWWPAANRGAPAMLYLHGSRWNLTGQLFRIEQLHDFGFSVLAIDYRGFGQSSAGLPSEQTVYQDAQAAWERLTRLQPEAERRFIYGHSLGGAVAVDLAAHLSEAPSRDAAASGLIVESSFTSLADIARSLTYPWLPVQLLLSQKFDSVDKIAKVHMPVLLVHGTGDRYVPSRFSQALFDAAAQPKKLLLVAGASHNNSIRMGSDEYRQALRELFALGTRPNKTAVKASS
jgi:alpha-beta hydrolase superfamily lysophospholipase